MYAVKGLVSDKLQMLRKYMYMYTEPQKKRRNFHNSIRYGKQKYLFLFFKLQIFIATQGVGTRHKMLTNNKLPLHQNFIITHRDNFIV